MSSLSRKRKKIRKGTCGSCGESHIFGTYRCPQCDLKSNCPAELEIHMDDVHSCNLEYFCPFCDVMCSGYPELEQHVIMGHGFTIVEAKSADVSKRKKISLDDVSVNESTVKLNNTKTIAVSSSCESVNIVTNAEEQPPEPHRQNKGILDAPLPSVDLKNVASIDEIDNCTMNQNKVIAAPASLFGNIGGERNDKNQSQSKNNEGRVLTSKIPVIDLTADVDDFSVNPSLIDEVSVEVILNNKEMSNKCDANGLTSKLKPDESCLTPVGVEFANNICNKSIDKDKELNESAQVSITKTKDAKSTLLDPGCDRAVLTPVLEIYSEEFGVPFQEKSSEEPASTSGHFAPSSFETQTTTSTIKRRVSCSKEKYHKHEKLVVSNWWQKMAKNKRKSSEMATKESADEDAVGKSSNVEGVISSTESQMNSLTLVNLKNHERSYSLQKMRDAGNSSGQQPTPVVDQKQKRSLSDGCSKISETNHELCIEKTNAGEEIGCSSDGELLKTKQSKSDKESRINQLKENLRQRKRDSRKSLLMRSNNTPNSFTSSTGKKSDSEFECDANSIESLEGENSTAKNQCQNEKSKDLAKEDSSKAVKSKRLEECLKGKRNKLSDMRKKFSKANPFQKKKKIEISEIVSDIPVYSDKSSSEDSCSADDMEYDADDIDYIKVNIDKSFQCTKCNVRLGNMFAIRSHCKELHLPMRPYCCSNCHYTGKSTAKLTAHFKKRHFSDRSVIVTKNSVADIQHTAWNTIHSKIIGKIGLEPSNVSTEVLPSNYSSKKSSITKKSNKAFFSKRYNFLKLPVYKPPQSLDAFEPLNLKRSTCNSETISSKKKTGNKETISSKKKTSNANSETISSKKKNKFDSLHAPVSIVGSNNDSAVGSSSELFFPSVFPASGAVSNTSVAGASTDVSSTSTSTPATVVFSSSTPACHSRPKSTPETSPVIQSPILPQNYIIVHNRPTMKQNLVQMSQTQTSPSTQLTFTLMPQTSPVSAVPICSPPVVTMASQPFTAIPISMLSRGVLIPQGPLIQSSVTPEVVADRNVVSKRKVSVSSSVMSPCVSQQENSVPTQSLNEKISIARLFPKQKNSSVKQISKEKTGSVENSTSSSVGENVTSKKIKKKLSSNAKKPSLPSDEVEIVQETLSKVDTVFKPTNTVKPMLQIGENQYGSVSDGHPCPLCGKRYSPFKLVVFHVVIDHLFFEPYICNCTRLCSMKFRSIYPLLKHMCDEHAVYPQIFFIDEPVKLQQVTACQKLFTRSAFEEHQQHEKKLFAESIVIIANSVHLGEMAALRYRSTLTSEQVPNVNLSKTPNNTGTPMNVALPSGNSDSELSILEPSVSLMCTSSQSVERYFSNLLYSTASKHHTSTTTKQSTAFGETSTHSGPIPSTRNCSETLSTNVRAKPTATTRIQISAADESTGALPPVMQSSEPPCPLLRTALLSPSIEASTSIQNISIQTQPDVAVATAPASVVTSNSHCEKISQDQNGDDIKTPCYSVENTGMYRCLKCHEICNKFSVLVNHIKVCHMTSLLPFECFLCLEKFSLAGDAICHMFVQHHVKYGCIRINLTLSGLQERRCHNLLACPEYKSYTEAYKIFLKTQLCKQSSQPPDKVICRSTDKLIFASTSMPNEFAYLYVVDNSIITVCQLNGQIFERSKGLGSKRSCSQSNAFDDVERRAAGLSYSRRFSKEELTRHLPAHVADSVEFIELNEDDNNEAPIALLENMTSRIGEKISSPCEMSETPNNEQVDDSRYKCSHCDYMSGFFECLLSHICSEHSKWKPYLCLKCTTAFPSLFHFFLHISNGCWTREMSVSFELYRLQKVVVESCCRLLGNETISEKVKLKFRDWVWFTNDKKKTVNNSAALYHIAEHHYMSTSVLKYAAHIKEIWRWDIYKSRRKKNSLTFNTPNDWHFNIDVITPTMLLTNKFISNGTLLPNQSGEQQIDSVHESARVDSCQTVEDILTPTLSSDISENILKRSSSENSNESQKTDTPLLEKESLTGTIRCPMCKAIHSSVTMLMIHYQKLHLEQYKPFHCCLCDYCCQCLSDFILHVHYLHFNSVCKVAVHLEEIEKQDQAVLFAFEDCGDHFDIYVKFRTKFLAKYLKKIEAECNSKKRIDVYMVEEPITKSMEYYALASGQHTPTFNEQNTFKADTTATKKPTNDGDNKYQYGISSTVDTDSEVITISDDVECISSEDIVVPVSQNSLPQPYNDIPHQTSDSNLNNDSGESIQTALNENGDRNISLAKETLNRKTNVADKNVELSAASNVETTAPTDESSSNDSSDVQYLPVNESSVSFRPKDAPNTDNNSDEIIIKENSKKSGENEVKKKEILLQEPMIEVQDIVSAETKSSVLIKAFRTGNSEPSYEEIRKLISMLDMVLKPEQYIHCYFCKIRFNKVNKLQVHLKKQHMGLSPFSCVKCGYMATTREVIISHLSSVHDICKDDSDKHIVISESQLRKQKELLNFLMLIGFNLSKIVGAKSLLDHIPCKLQCPSVSTCKPVNSLADMQLHIFVNHVCCINDKDLTCCIKSCKKSIKLDEAVSHFHDHHPEFIAMFVVKPTPSSLLTTQFKQILAQVTIVSGQSVCNTQRYLYQVLSYYEKTIKK